MAERFDTGYEYDFDIHKEGEDEAPEPVGIADGATLKNADLDKLLSELRRSITGQRNSFWRDGFMLFRMLWLGTFVQDTRNNAKGNYSRTRAGLIDYFSDIGVDMSPDDLNRRLKVYATYRRYPEVISLVEEIGVSKAYSAAVYVFSKTVRSMLTDILQKNIRHSTLRKELAALGYPRNDGGGRREPDKDHAEREKQRRAIELLIHPQRVRVGMGVIGGFDKSVPPLFVPRHERMDPILELDCAQVFDKAMKRGGHEKFEDLLVLFRDFLYKNVLNDTDRQIVDGERQTANDQRLRQQAVIAAAAE